MGSTETERVTDERERVQRVIEEDREAIIAARRARERQEDAARRARLRFRSARSALRRAVS